MARSNAAPVTRRSFSDLKNPLEVPHLIDIQRRSFEELTDPKNGGLRETIGIPEEIDEENPIKDYAAEAITYPREPIDDHLDEYEHFGNRRLRTVGELIQDAFRIGLYRMERVVRERLTTEDADAITPQTIINIRPVVAALKEFFGSSQLSQFMEPDQLAGRAHPPPPPLGARRGRADP